MRKVQLSKMEHRGKVRIRVDIPYDPATILIIKSIKGYNWSQSKKCWYFPYTKDSYALLQQHFDISVPSKEKLFSTDAIAFKEKKPITEQQVLPIQEIDLSEKQQVVLVLPEHDFRVKVLVPFDRKDWIQKIKRLPNRAWNKAEQYWSVPKTEEVFALLQELFGVVLEVDVCIQWNIVKTNRVLDQVEPIQKSLPNKTYQHAAFVLSKEAEVIKKKPASVTDNKNDQRLETTDQTKVIVGQKIIIEQENEAWLRLFVPYDKKSWIGVVKDMLGRKWHIENKYWLIPYVQDNINRLYSLVGQEYLQFYFEINQTIPEFYQIEKKSKKKRSRYILNDVQQKAIIAFDGQMMMENKRWRTRKIYKALFTHFLVYFSKSKPSKISKVQIEEYIIFRKQDNISDSQLNQLINALNCFYIRLLEQEDKVVRLQRPKKKRKLPNVYSVEEIEALLKAPINLKHKSMLVLIYSGGLRRSEVLNLRVEDLNFNRKTMYVHNGKGGKDRYTFFSEVAQKILKKYLQQNELSYYLFEGQHGGKYSESSIHKIFDLARIKARVPRNVTIHGLRHSFATHLIERGVPLHVVQELLGHSSIKTTEIYLHISNKFRKELRSPLDDMEI